MLEMGLKRVMEAVLVPGCMLEVHGVVKHGHPQNWENQCTKRRTKVKENLATRGVDLFSAFKRQRKGAPEVPLKLGSLKRLFFFIITNEAPGAANGAKRWRRRQIVTMKSTSYFEKQLFILKRLGRRVGQIFPPRRQYHSQTLRCRNGLSIIFLKQAMRIPS